MFPDSTFFEFFIYYFTLLGVVFLFLTLLHRFIRLIIRIFSGLIY